MYEDIIIGEAARRRSVQFLTSKVQALAGGNGERKGELIVDTLNLLQKRTLPWLEASSNMPKTMDEWEQFYHDTIAAHKERMARWKEDGYI